MSQLKGFEEILKRVEKPGRYIGGEWNSVRKNPSRAEIKVALVFPDVYEIGMSYLGQKILYSVLNAYPSFLAERVFAPWPDFESELRASRTPLRSLENKIPLAEFDIIGFSLLYELNDSNILTILDLAGIPFFSEDRGGRFPLVIAGGPAAFNPEPLSDFFDAFVLGDGEEAFPEVAEKYRILRNKGADKEEILRGLAQLPGVYVPRLYESYFPAGSRLLARRPKDDAPGRVRKRVLTSLDGRYFPERIVVPDVQAVFDRVAVEVARGCPQRCRFCQATSLYFPFRVMRPATVLGKVRRSLASTGYEDVSLSALSVSDYPHLEKTVTALMEELSGAKVSLSLSSLRPGGLSAGVAENILRVRKTGFTIVPEAGTDRLRRVISKNLKNEEILAAAGHAFSRGWRLLKLYFMAGLPTEVEDDLNGIIDLVAEIMRLGKAIMKSAPRINLSLSSFIPKPHTPFQWLAMDEELVLLEKQRFVRAGLRRFSSVKVKDHPTKSSLLEGIFSRGDRRLGPVLVRAWKNGARFDSWKDHFDFSRWEAAFASENLDYGIYLGFLPTDTVLPWDHLETGIKKDSLRSELEKARAAEPTPSCLEAECRKCRGCEPSLRSRIRLSAGAGKKARVQKPFGERSDRLWRYEVRYSKLHSARFLSHRDTVNHLRRVLRRAGVEVGFSRGFHPQMLVSYAPALALGMAGREEIFEFRSPRLFEAQKTLRRLNSCVRSGIKFLSLRRLELADRPLSERIQRMVFSIDLKDPSVRCALKTRKAAGNAATERDFGFIDRDLAGLLKGEGGAVGWSLDKKRQKLFFELPALSRRGLRPQDIVSKVFGLENPAFFLTRERFIFADC